MITTSSTINITKTLRLGSVTDYTTDKVSLFIKTNGDQKRYNATSVVNSTVNSNGLVTFSNVPLPTDGSYSLYITAETNVDLDTDGTSLSRLATGFIKKITNETTLAL